MEELTKPIEELSLREVNLHRGQIVTLLTDRAGDVTGLVDMLCILNDRARELDPKECLRND